MGDFALFKGSAGGSGRAGSGHSPPADVRASELFRKLADTVPPHEILPFPRKDEDGQPVGHYWLRVLPQREIDDAAVEAERYVRKRMRDGGDADLDGVKPNQEAWREVFGSALMVELVFRACRDKDNAALPLFPSPDDIRRELSQSEIVFLSESYEALQRRFGPTFATLTEDEVEEWIAALTRGGAVELGPLGLLSRGGLEQLIGGLVFEVQTLRTGTSSSGPQSSDSRSDTESTSRQRSGFIPDDDQG